MREKRAGLIVLPALVKPGDQIQLSKLNVLSKTIKSYVSKIAILVDATVRRMAIIKTANKPVKQRHVGQ